MNAGTGHEVSPGSQLVCSIYLTSLTLRSHLVDVGFCLASTSAWSCAFLTTTSQHTMLWASREARWRLWPSYGVQICIWVFDNPLLTSFGSVEGWCAAAHFEGPARAAVA